MLARHPILPWRQIAEAGHAYRHGYDAIAPARIIDTVREDFPPLLALVTAGLNSPA